MKPAPTFLFGGGLEDMGSTVAMDIDDSDALEMLAEGVGHFETKLVDSDFFNKFEDDFDDSDIN